MRATYQFNESDERTNAWGRDTYEVIIQNIRSKNSRYSIFSESRPIEDQIETIAGNIGGLCHLLISKGLITPEEFLVAIGVEDRYEAREKVGL